MIDVERALELLAAAALPGPVGPVALEASLGRVLAEDVTADRDFPPTDRSAMDGFAVRAGVGIAPGQSLELVGEVRAGQSPAGIVVGAGQAVRIMTGSVIPDGADAVVMVERTRTDEGERRVVVDEAPRPGQHIRRRGEERRRGDVLLSAGTPIRPAEISGLASVGQARPQVFEMPAVHVLSTGDEIVGVEEVPAQHQVRNSNAPMLLALLRDAGVEGRGLGVAPDTPAGLEQLLARGLAGRLLLVTGGVSVGRYDLVRRTLESMGMTTLFHGVAVKPGKPLLAGRVGDCLVVGLPGNPVSTFAAFTVFVAPALRRMTGRRHWRSTFVNARLLQAVGTRPGRETYHLARLAVEGGEPVARPIATTGSGDVNALALANGFVVVGAEGGELQTGARVRTLPWVPWDTPGSDGPAG